MNIKQGEVVQASNKKWLDKHITVRKDKITIGVLFGTTKIAKADVKQVKEMSSSISSTKTAGGTIGGAVVGGLLTGGVGALVGGLAFGNHKGFDVKIAFELANGEWFVVQYANKKSKGFIAETMLKQIDTIRQHYTSNPFDA